MTTAVTKESLAARIAELESGARSLKEDYTLAAYKMLLATMEAEPVAEVIQKLNGYDRPLYVVAIEGEIEEGDVLYRHAQPAPVVSAELLHTAASAIEDLLTTKDRMGVYVCFDLPFRLRSAANAQPAPELKPVGYLFVSDQGAITYSLTDWGMPGFKLAGQIFGDIDVELKPAPVVLDAIDTNLIEALRLVQCMLDDYRERNYGDAQGWIRHINTHMSDYTEAHGDDAYSVLHNLITASQQEVK